MVFDRRQGKVAPGGERLAGAAPNGLDLAQTGRPPEREDASMSIVFASRTDAARQLASALAKFRGRNPLVLAIPRGAVAMGRVLADELEGEIDVVLVRKLRSPQSAEFAVGAIDETGWAYVADYAASAGADDAYLAREKQDQLELLRKRRALYTPARPPIDPTGRVVIVVDDGLATGATMIAALHAVAVEAARAPRRAPCRSPPPDSLERVPALRRRGRLPRGAGGVLRGRPVLPPVRTGGGRRSGRSPRARAESARGVRR